MEQNSSESLIKMPARRLTGPAALAGTALLILATALFYSSCGNELAESVSASPATESIEATGWHALPTPVPTSVLIPNGTVLSVRLLETVSSRTARPGQEFAAELAAPVVTHNKVMFPRSARVRGRVVSARESGGLRQPGYLRLTLDAVQLPDGKWVDLHTTSISAEGRSQKKRDWTPIGGGAKLRALVGGIADGGENVAIGAAPRAGAGTAGILATGRQDVTVAAERKLTFATVEEMVMNR
jgi:hypothetical protein